MKILDLGSGRDWTLMINDERFTESDHITIVDRSIPSNMGLKTKNGATIHIYGKDVFNFLEEYPNRDFDRIHSRRFFEHLTESEISYLIYLLYEVSKKETLLDIIVPDFDKVSNVVKSLDPNNMSVIEFNKNMVSVITEIYNTENDPHKSIWNEQLGRYYIELESYWKVVDINKNINISNRDWYLHFRAESTRC